MVKMVCRTPERSFILFPVFNTGTPAVKAFENIDVTSLKDRIYFYSPPVNNVGDVRSYLDDYSMVLIEVIRGWRYYLHLLRTLRLSHLCQEKTRRAVYMNLDVLDSMVRHITIVLPLKQTVGLTVAQLADHKHILDFFFRLIPLRERIKVCYRSREPRMNTRTRIEELTRYHLYPMTTEIQWNGKGAAAHFVEENALIVWFEPCLSLRAVRHLRRQFSPRPFVIIPLPCL